MTTTTTLTSHYLDHEATLFHLNEVEALRDREIAIYFSDSSWERASFCVYSPDQIIGNQVAVAVCFRIPLPHEIWSPADGGFVQASYAKVPPMPGQIYLTHEGLDALEIPKGKKPCVLHLN